MVGPGAGERRLEHRDALRRFWLFADLAEPEIKQIAALARVQRNKAREVVVSQGDDSADLFLIVEGRLKATSSNANGDEVMLSIMSPGDVFGEMALLDGEPRSATVLTLETCQLLVIEARAFQALLLEIPSLAMSLMKVMARRLRDLTHRTQDVSLLDVERRLAKIVLALAGRFGDRGVPGTITITLKLSQQELASMVGATRELVNRRLRHWVHEDIVEFVAGLLVIKDEASLRDLVGHDGETDGE
jgi:CRP/FNR family cyclic AMP-dependent transcriptional regulator